MKGERNIMKFITLKWLEKHHACQGDITYFIKEFYPRVSIKKIVENAHQPESPMWEGWLMGKDLTVTKVMLKEGANIHAFDDYALKCVAGNGDLELVKFLIKKGANIHANNNRALNWAENAGHQKVVRFFRKLYKKEKGE